MSRHETWILPAAPWHECVLEGLPYAARAGDAIITPRPADVLAAVRAAERPVLVGPHLLLPGDLQRLPRACALYETEQREWMPTRARRYYRWRTYSRALASRIGAEYWPLVPRVDDTVAVARRAPHVLFYGSMNARRAQLLHAIEARGVPITCVYPPANLFGTALQVALRQCTLVLSAHYYLPGIFPAFRIVPAISAGAPVVSELCEDNEGAELSQVGGGITWAPYENLAATVEKTFRLLAERRPVLRGNADDDHAD